MCKCETSLILSLLLPPLDTLPPLHHHTHHHAYVHVHVWLQNTLCTILPLTPNHPSPLPPPPFPSSPSTHSLSNGDRRVSMKERSLASDTLKHNHSKTPEVHLIKKRGRKRKGGRERGEGEGGEGGKVHLINNDTLPPNLNSLCSQ